MRYKSYSRTTKTYHGVTFNPGDEKDVNGYINDSRFVRVKEKPKKKKSTTSDGTPQSVKRDRKLSVSQDKDVEVQSTSTIGVQEENKFENKQTKNKQSYEPKEKDVTNKNPVTLKNEKSSKSNENAELKQEEK